MNLLSYKRFLFKNNLSDFPVAGHTCHPSEMQQIITVKNRLPHPDAPSRHDHDRQGHQPFCVQLPVTTRVPDKDSGFIRYRKNTSPGRRKVKKIG